MSNTALPDQSRSHSSVVRMRLEVGGDVFKIGQLAPDFIIIRDTVNLPPCEGEMMLSVDGKERRWKVSLPDGASEDVVKTKIVAETV